MPDFTRETCLRDDLGLRADEGVIVGLDEAGRGPWAGPVIAAAVWLDPRRCPADLRARLDDSKALTARARDDLNDALHACVRAGTAGLALGHASVVEIDDANILQASLRAMARAATRLGLALGRPLDGALVDGTKLPDLPCPARAVVKGDRASLSIAAASIVAKVARDRLMEDLAARYPGYGWERNRGYGTAEHRAALTRLGVTPEHRRSFAPVKRALT